MFPNILFHRTPQAVPKLHKSKSGWTHQRHGESQVYLRHDRLYGVFKNEIPSWTCDRILQSKATFSASISYLMWRWYYSNSVYDYCFRSLPIVPKYSQANWTLSKYQGPAQTTHHRIQVVAKKKNTLMWITNDPKTCTFTHLLLV